jgi:hypothetical protein
MAELFGRGYYLDLDNAMEKCKVYDEDKKDDGNINIFKYELMKMCIDRVLNEFNDEEVDSKLFSSDGEKDNLSFDIAVNTLIKNDILIFDVDYE